MRCNLIRGVLPMAERMVEDALRQYLRLGEGPVDWEMNLVVVDMICKS